MDSLVLHFQWSVVYDFLPLSALQRFSIRQRMKLLTKHLRFEIKGGRGVI
jgi:hypothetical protein